MKTILVTGAESEKPDEARPLTNSSRIPSLDGLRGLACLMVIVAHYFPAHVHAKPGSIVPTILWPLQFGGTGVDLFFVLSGFLLGGICLDNRDSSNYYAAFYARRSCRIFPVYYLWLASSIPLAVFGRPETGGRLLNGDFPWWSYVVYCQNFFMAVRGNFGPHWLAISWSLAIEEQFYLMLPVLIRTVPPRRLPGTVWGLWGLTTAMRAIVLCWPPDSSPFPEPGLAAYVLTTCHMDGLFLGVLAAWALRQHGATSFIAHRLPLLWCLAIALAVLSLWLRHVSIATPAIGVPFQTAVAGFYLCLLLLAIHSPLAGRFFRMKPLMFMGMISYGAYLLHQGVLSVMHKAIFHQSPQIASLAELVVTFGALTVTTFVAWLSYRYYELPFVTFGRRVQYARSHGIIDGVAISSNG